MNLTLPKEEKLNRKTIAIYVIVTVVCILAIIIVVGIQILGDDIINNLFGINKLVKRTQQEEFLLKANFETLFNNQIEDKGNYRTQKIDENKEIVYTSYQKEEKTQNHEINVNLPYINIKNKEIQNFNQEMSDIFQAKAEDITDSKYKNIIYTVKYKCYIENNILSLVIYSDLKQDTNPQRVIVQTFNFNLEQNKKLTLGETLKIYNLSENEVQNKINENIMEEQKKANDLKQLGYEVFSRDIQSKIYKIENVTEFFIYDNNIYIIFAYGNNGVTSEKDLVII